MQQNQQRVLGIVTPSVNTCVQPEFEAMRPPCVTHQISRMWMESVAIHDDNSFMEVIRAIDRSVEPAVDSVMKAKPDHLIVGVSIEAVWGGLSGADSLRKRIEDRSGTAVTLASDALIEAVRVSNIGGPSAVVAPYRPPGMEQVKNFFAECKIPLVRTRALPHDRSIDLAHYSKASLVEALRALDGPDIAGIVQFGANVAMAQLAGEAENWLGKPVIAVNTATYWHGLRSLKIDHKIDGFGQLFRDH
jgi:maleate isomerase